MRWFKDVNSVNVIIISFVLSGVLIGVLLAAQFQSSVTSNSFLVDELNAQKELSNSFDVDRINLKSQVSLLQQELDENRKKLENAGNSSSLEKLDLLKDSLGLSKLKGKGVVISIGEGKNNKSGGDANLIHASDLRDLVNLLRTAKADGLSINDQRIIAQSTISSLGSTIMINKVKLAAPFEIKVIGETDMIATRINDQKSYPDLYKRIKNRDVEFEIVKADQLILPAFDGDYLFKYAQNQ